MRRKGDFNPGRFWRWFDSERHGLANAIAALARGEADAEWALVGLTDRIRRYDPVLQADIRMGLDGQHQLIIWGDNLASISALFAAAPRLAGWRLISPGASASPDERRVPFRLAPRPSVERESPIHGLHEAWSFGASALVH